jgi:oxygen-dependent protoporphyrinogen oxidase
MVNTTNENLPRIAVIGGGISGLAAAHRLNELQPQWPVELLEATGRLGGVLQTVHEDGYLIEEAADNFLSGPSAPWAVKLCERLGFADQLIPTNDQFRGAKVFWNGRLLPIPQGFQLMAPSRLWPLLTSPLLSPLGRLRLICEPLVPAAKGEGEQSLAEFVTHRLGREALDRLVEPLVAGIYTADSRVLSVQAALPQMAELVREHGSLYRGMVRRQNRQRSADASQGARYSLFVAPRLGISSMIDAISKRLSNTNVRIHSRVAEIRSAGADRWSLRINDQTGTETYDGLIIALPAPAAARVVSSINTRLESELAEIEHASSAVVVLGYRENQIQRPLNAFGCVVPAVQNRQILAISCSSAKFPGRAPASCELFRVFVGGALQPRLAELPDAELTQLAQRELADMLATQGSPQICRVVRWRQAMPQYVVGHLDRLNRIRQLMPSAGRLQLAGNAYQGVGIPQCIRSGESAAEDLVNACRSG